MKVVYVLGVLALILVSLAVVFVAVPRAIPCTLEVRLYRAGTDQSVIGAGVEVWDGRTLIVSGSTGLDGVARFGGLPCKAISFSYGGGDWVKSDKAIVVLTPDRITQVSRPLFSCPTPPCG